MNKSTTSGADGPNLARSSHYSLFNLLNKYKYIRNLSGRIILLGCFGQPLRFSLPPAHSVVALFSYIPHGYARSHINIHIIYTHNSTLPPCLTRQPLSSLLITLRHHPSAGQDPTPRSEYYELLTRTNIQPITPPPFAVPLDINNSTIQLCVKIFDSKLESTPCHSKFIFHYYFFVSLHLEF